MGEGRKILRFDDVGIDLGAMLVTKAGARVDLEPKAFDVLVHLVSRRGQLVTKQELIDTVWHELAVTDHVLTRIVGQIRRALGDDPREARYIETVPTRGYRFIAAIADDAPALALPAAPSRPKVQAEVVDDAPTPGPPTHRSRVVYAAIAVAVVLSLSVGFVLASRARVDSSAPERIADFDTRPRQLTFAPTLDVYPSFSPDSKLIAYATGESGAFEIEVRSLVLDASPRRVTSDGQGNVQPDWSPDGQFIAYHSMVQGGVWMMPALGGVARRLAPAGASPAWSPDGATIAYQSSEPSAVAIPGTPPPSRLWRLDVATGRTQPLTAPGHPLGGHTDPAWSPNGRLIAFVARGVSKTEIWIVATGDSEPLRTWECAFDCGTPSFEPDGNGLVFSITGGGYYRLAIDPATGAPRGQPQLLLSQRGDVGGHLALSPDGRMLAVADLTARSNLYSLALDAAGRAVGEPRALTNNTARNSTPLFSPDGQWIAYASRQGTLQVRIISPDGSRGMALPLAPGLMASYSPAWSSAGEVLSIGIGGGQASLVAMRLDSREPRTVVESLGPLGLTTSVQFIAPRLMPDGQHLLFGRDEGATTAIWIMNLASRQARRLTPLTEAATFPTPSADGKWFVYERVANGSMHAVVMPVAGGAARQLTDGRGLIWSHTVAADNDRIFAAMRRGERWSVGWISQSSGETVVLLTAPKPNQYLRYPAVSPDGRQVVYEQSETVGNIWLIPYASAGQTSRLPSSSLDAVPSPLRQHAVGAQKRLATSVRSSTSG